VGCRASGTAAVGASGAGRAGISLGEKHRGRGGLAAAAAGGQKGIYLQYPNRRHY